MKTIVISEQVSDDDKTRGFIAHICGNLKSRFPDGHYYIPDPADISDYKYQLQGTEKVVIAGGGYAGALAAMALLKENPSLDVTIVEARSPTRCVGGPCTCKGCMGGVSSKGIEMIRSLGIEFPDDLFTGQAAHIGYVNVRENIGLDKVEPKATPELKFISHGFGPAALQLGTRGQKISMADFLRSEAKKRGVKIVTGAVTHIAFPEYRSHPAYVRYETGSSGNILDAELVINATGVNGRGLDLMRYHPNPDNGEIIPGKILSPAPATHFASVFEIPITDQQVADLKMSPHVFYYWYGVPNTEAILTMLKRSHGEQWVTVVVSPKPKLMRDANSDDERKQKIGTIFRSFLEMSGMGKFVGDRMLCQCLSKIPVDVTIFPGVRNYPGHRYVMVGDASGVIRYKKSGIAYLIECAFIIANTAVTCGVTGDSLASSHDVFAANVHADNLVGQFLFAASCVVNRSPFLSRMYGAMLNVSFVGDAVGRVVMGHTGLDARYATSLPVAVWRRLRGMKEESPPRKQGPNNLHL